MLTNVARSSWLVAALAFATALSSACAKPLETATQSPSAAMVALIGHARANNEAAFKEGLSANFLGVVQRYAELAETKPELRGAFTVGTFMRAFALDMPVPKEEMVKGTKATVRAETTGGNSVSAKMVLEDGRWKLEVPDGLVKNLDHFDEVVNLAKGEVAAPMPEIPTGGGGKADRVKNLAPDATPAQKQKAAALDAFDLGDITGAGPLLDEARKAMPDDEELVVATGRLYVQTNRGQDAINLFEAHIKKSEKSVVARHYLGMAYMFVQRYDDAAAQWNKVVELDPVYGGQFRLADRAKIAIGMKEAAANPQNVPHGPGGMPGGGGGGGGHGMPGGGGGGGGHGMPGGGGGGGHGMPPAGGGHGMPPAGGGHGAPAGAGDGAPGQPGQPAGGGAAPH